MPNYSPPMPDHNHIGEPTYAAYVQGCRHFQCKAAAVEYRQRLRERHMSGDWRDLRLKQPLPPVEAMLGPQPADPPMVILSQEHVEEVVTEPVIQPEPEPAVIREPVAAIEEDPVEKRVREVTEKRLRESGLMGGVTPPTSQPEPPPVAQTPATDTADRLFRYLRSHAPVGNIPSTLGLDVMAFGTGMSHDETRMALYELLTSKRVRRLPDGALHIESARPPQAAPTPLRRPGKFGRRRAA